MNSDTLYRYYKAYIEDADNEILTLLKVDITKERQQGTLINIHYIKLVRLIAKRKKEIRISKVA